MNFTKMQGTGNDFIIINGFKHKINDYKSFSREICDRHFGAGGDGLIIVLPPSQKENDFKMRIFNADGSEAEMCGNGIRCLAHYIGKKISTKRSFKIETKAGIIIPEIITTSNNSSQIRVNMGIPGFKPSDIPVNIKDQENFIEDYQLNIEQNTFEINCVSMGNPHTIIFKNNINKIDLSYWGPKIENHKIFPHKTNVEFIEIINSGKIKMKVWERGSGITLACGTGACAAVVAGTKKGLLKNRVNVKLPGGKLEIYWSGKEKDSVLMTGPASTVYEGVFII